MKLWTIQKITFYDELRDKGVVKAKRFDRTKALIDDSFLSPYEWLVRQMVLKRMSKNHVWPFWAWYKYNGLYKKPDLRCSGLMSKGTKSICIEFEMEDSKVLLSQFEMWCAILNCGYLAYDELESDQIEKLEKFKKLSQSCITKSWLRAFDLGFGCEDFWGSRKERCIQACITSIQMNQVKDVQEFIAR